jgi:hypothetical protein
MNTAGIRVSERMPAVKNQARIILSRCCEIFLKPIY